MDGVQYASQAQWLEQTSWWVVKGTTGSGKTFFVEQLKNRIKANNWPVVYVPQFPMFKPQLAVSKFLNLVPLSRDGRKALLANLELLQVTTKGLIGGKMMGMLDLPGLSGGDRKKLLIAISVQIAIEFQCPFIVMDEPFAGIDERAMGAVLQVMGRATAAVPGLKLVTVTHDHLALLPKSASLLQVADRLVSGHQGQYRKDNITAAVEFTETLLSVAVAEPKRRPIFDLYMVKLHFIEQEFMVPLMAYLVFGCLLGAVVVNYTGGLPGQGRDAIYIFLKIFIMEYPHFGNVINYCYKRGQHMEDYFLNISPKEFGIAETTVIALLQMSVLLAIMTAVMGGIAGFWWINIEVVLVDFAYIIEDSLLFLLLPIIFPNPIVAVVSILPYVCTVIFLNGVLLTQEWIWPGLKWVSYISPPYHVGCAYTFFTDEIVLSGTSCMDSAVPHIMLANPFFFVVLLGVAVKMFLNSRAAGKLRVHRAGDEPRATKPQPLSAVPDIVAAWAPADGTELSPTHKAGSLSKAKVQTWLAAADWWVVKGATGSGKTYFVEDLKSCIRNRGREVVHVPQYPVFKPQLPVMKFIDMLPLSKEVRKELLSSLEEMAVPTKGLIGGMLMGMLNVPGLSGGQRKKLLVAISVAIASQFQCPFVVMDEPFAGIDANSMRSVIGVLEKAPRLVPGLKYMIVTHDHLEMLSTTSSVLEAKDRQISGSSGFSMGNGEAAKEFCEVLLALAPGSQKRRPWIDLYLIKRYFIEKEFMMTLMTYIIFGTLLGAVTAKYEGGLPGVNFDVIYTFMKLFVLEYPHFGSIINYCFKRGQHLEDYYMNITSSRSGIIETVIIAVLQQVPLVVMANAIMCGISRVWWINVEVVLIDVYYGVASTIAYFLLPTCVPNPIFAMFCLFPYVSVWGFTNGIMMPKEDVWSGLKWTASLSPMYNVGCAYTFVTDKIVLASSDCYDSVVPHLIFISPLTWFVLIGLAAKTLFARARAHRAKKQPAPVKAPEGPTSV